MIATIIILSIVIVLLLRYIFKRRRGTDDRRLYSNRRELEKLLREDCKNGGITKEYASILRHVFHIDFRNMMSYVPPERQTYERNIISLDSSFWDHYLLTPDFVIPARMVYELYKNYLIENDALLREKKLIG